MSNLNGIFISLTAAGNNWLSAGEPLYLGIVSPIGSQEIALDVSSLANFQDSSVVTFSIGPAAAVFGGQSVDVDLSQVAKIPAVTHVYLRRKSSSGTSKNVDWQLRSAFIYVMAKNAPFRIFSTQGEKVCQPDSHIWLREIGHSGKLVQKSTPQGINTPANNNALMAMC